MKNLLLISILATLMVGCVSIKPLHITRDKCYLTRCSQSVTRYSSPATSHIFKATLEIKKHRLTGLLVIKRMETSSPAPPQTGSGDSCDVYRIVFMNEIGMKFFDLEMKADSFNVISCFESLNKKSLIKILETDFRMLTWPGSFISGKGYRQKKNNNLVVSATTMKYKTWQTYSPSADTLYSTSAKSTLFDPVIISFDRYTNGFPDRIVIKNPFIGMKLSLKKLVQ